MDNAASASPPSRPRPRRRRHSHRGSAVYLGHEIPAYTPLPRLCEGEQPSPSDRLFTTLTSVEHLTRSWQSVLANDAKDGNLTKETQSIAARADEIITELSKELRDGTYRPAPLFRYDIPKSHGDGVRTLRIPTIRDRVVERALLDAITRTVDLHLSANAYAYRTGRGTNDAIHHLTQLRDAGYTHVLRTDIADYFPNLDVEDALLVLRDLVHCPRTVALTRLLAQPRRARGERRTRSRGIAQGSSLSPLLANLALTPIDQAVADAGYGYLRFADDILVCAPTRDALTDAYTLLTGRLTALGLRLKEDKTVLTTFDDEFVYLGKELSATHPRLDPHHDVKGDPDPRHVVYAAKDGSRVRVSQGRLIIEGSDGLPQVSIPRNQVTRLVLSGTVGLSSGARSWALRNDVDVVFLSRRGGYLGQLSGPRSTANARRLLTQAALSADDDARLPLARSIVTAKTRHQVNVLHRLGRRTPGTDTGSPAATIRTAAADLRYATTIDEVMGIEGAASLTYFHALGGLVPDNVRFDGRSRRPPKDLANAALSYGYAILLSECTGALLAAGLEPSLGVLHSSTDKRPSLSLDLMEEFRPLLVDRTVMALLRTRRLRPEHATPSPDDDGVWLDREGKKALVDGYEATLQRHVSGALPGFSGTWRRHIHHEAQLFARAIVEPDYQWEGTAWR